MLSCAVLPAVLLTLGALNWCTTCCCGNSMILEILHCSCEQHNAEHNDPDHPSDNPHPCHKQGGESFLTAADPDIDFTPAAVGLQAESADISPGTPSPVEATWTVPRGEPPDIPLMTQRWLI